MSTYRYSTALPLLLLAFGAALLGAPIVSIGFERFSSAAAALTALASAGLFFLAWSAHRYRVEVDAEGFRVKGWASTRLYRFSDVRKISSVSGKGGPSAAVTMADGTKVSFFYALPNLAALLADLRKGANLPKKVWEPV